MAIFGQPAATPFDEAAQRTADQQTAFASIKDNLPALGLIAGLSMLARNNGTRSVGQLIGQAGGDALNAYGTWQKIEQAKQRQKMLDDIAAEERQYGRSQDAFRNDLDLKQFGLQQAKMAQDMQLARQRLGMEGARIAMARQLQAQALADADAKRKYDETHAIAQDGTPLVLMTKEDGTKYYAPDESLAIRDKNGTLLGYRGMKQPEEKFSDVLALKKNWQDQSEDFFKLADTTSQMFTNAKLGNSAGDIALLYGFMKAQDPNSTVREGEFATAQNAGGVSEKFRGLYNSVMQGKLLTPAQRRQFVQQANAMLMRSAKRQELRNAEYRDMARRRGWNEGDVVSGYSVMPMTKEINDWILDSFNN